MTKTIDYDVWVQPVDAPAEAENPEFNDFPIEVIDEELMVTPLPIQRDEFRCGCCFLIRHVSQLGGKQICIDCV